MDDAIGYYAIVIPAKDSYSGFFLLPDPQDTGGIMVKAAKEALADLYQAPSAEMQGVAGVMKADQPVLGALTAALIEHYQKGDQARLIPTANAITKLIGVKFWYVSARIERAGTLTTLHRLDRVRRRSTPDLPALSVPVTTIAEARESLLEQPEIREINRRVASQPGTWH